MRINPGGRLSPQDTVGRDQEIARYWQILLRQGLVLSAERRIGKTSIALKMKDECHPGFVAFYQDLEAIHSVRDLLCSVYRAVEASLPRTERWKGRLAKWSTLLPERIGGLDLSMVRDNWHSLLATVFNDLVEIAGDQIVLLMWDEFPLMLDNLRKRGGETLAIELLNHLRAQRQQHSTKLRFLFTGSIGLHLVLRSLQRAGNTNDPTNDLFSTTVPPMAEAEARKLILALLREVSVDAGEREKIASAISAQIGGFPYYIHHILDQLHQLRRPVVCTDVAGAVDSLLYDPQDSANLRYYRVRIGSYYDVTERPLAIAILDVVSNAVSPQSLETITNLVKHRIMAASEEDIRGVLTLLVEDHYLTPRPAQGRMCYDFRWALVKRWWRETSL